MKTKKVAQNIVKRGSTYYANFTNNQGKRIRNTLSKDLALAKVELAKLKANIEIQNTPQHHHLPTKAQEVYDVSGAGDTFTATLTLALAAHAELYEATQIANHAAGVVVGKFGTSTLTLEELKSSFNGKHSKVKTREELVKIVKKLKSEGKII